MKASFRGITRTVLFFSVTLVFFLGSSYSKDSQALVDKVWEYSLAHPDGFTIHIPDFEEPTYGIAVAYAYTQFSHSKESLPRVIKHAMEHDGYVGGWLDTDTGLYYFDSSKLFPETEREAAIAFGLENKQLAIYVISTGETIDLTDFPVPPGYN